MNWLNYTVTARHIGNETITLTVKAMDQQGAIREFRKMVRMPFLNLSVRLVRA